MLTEQVQPEAVDEQDRDARGEVERERPRLPRDAEDGRQQVRERRGPVRQLPGHPWPTAADSAVAKESISATVSRPSPASLTRTDRSSALIVPV